MPRRSPDEQPAVALRQRVGEDERALLRKPQRRLTAPTALVERDEPARQLVAGLNRLELRLRDVVAPEEPRAEPARAVTPDECVDVANVVRLQHDRERRPPR